MAIRSAFAVLLVISTTAAGCASTSSRLTPGIQQILAPTGSLRVALYTGTPTSVLSETDLRGVGYDLGKAMALRLGIPFQPIVFTRNVDVLEAVKTGRADVAFTNATAERAKDMDFTAPYLAIQLGFLATANAPVAALGDVDRSGVRVGVTARSSSDAFLSHSLKNAQLFRADTVADGIGMLATGVIDVYATNKATLFEMAARVPGSRVLAGSWGIERHALAIPKGRDRGLPYAGAFIADAVVTGLVRAAVDRAGLRGAVIAISPQPSH